MSQTRNNGSRGVVYKQRKRMSNKGKMDILGATGERWRDVKKKREKETGTERKEKRIECTLCIFKRFPFVSHASRCRRVLSCVLCMLPLLSFSPFKTLQVMHREKKNERRQQRKRQEDFILFPLDSLSPLTFLFPFFVRPLLLPFHWGSPHPFLQAFSTFALSSSLSLSLSVDASLISFSPAFWTVLTSSMTNLMSRVGTLKMVAVRDGTADSTRPAARTASRVDSILERE